MSREGSRAHLVLAALLPLLALTAACERTAPASSSSARRDSSATRPATRTAATSDTAGAEAGPATCGDTAESRALACARGHARRLRDTLVLDVAGGRPPVRLVDDSTNGEQFVAYTLTGTVLGGRYYVLDARGYEGGWTELVDARSGERVRLASDPVPSPDGAHLAAAARDLEIAEGATRLEIWRVQPDRPALEFVLQPYDQMDDVRGWGPGDPIWRGADTLAVPRYFIDRTRPAGEAVRDTALVVRDGRTWRLEARDRTR